MAKRTHDQDPLEEARKKSREATTTSSSSSDSEESSSDESSESVSSESPLAEEPERTENLLSLLAFHQRLLATHCAKEGNKLETFKMTRYYLDVAQEMTWSTRFLTQVANHCGEAVHENPVYIERWGLLLAYRREQCERNFRAWFQHVLDHTGEESHCTVDWCKKVGPENFYSCRCPGKCLKPSHAKKDTLSIQ